MTTTDRRNEKIRGAGNLRSGRWREKKFSITGPTNNGSMSSCWFSGKGLRQGADVPIAVGGFEILNYRSTSRKITTKKGPGQATIRTQQQRKI